MWASWLEKTLGRRHAAEEREAPATHVRDEADDAAPAAVALPAHPDATAWSGDTLMCEGCL